YLQGPDHGQQGQGGDHIRHRARPDRSRAREDGLPGRRRARSDFVTADAADSGEAAGVAPAADPGFLQRHGGTIEYILIPGAALVGALAVFGIFVALFGKNPLDLYFYMYQGAFGTWFSWQNSLTRAAPLILTALCTALPAQLGMVIIGGEGALLIGALAATSAALLLPSAPPLVAQLAMVLAGSAGGNVRAAKIVGLGVGRLILITCFIAGACAGLAGMIEVAAVQGRTNANLAAGYGFTGILVAFLARQNPLAVIPVAILLGGISA